MNQFRKCNVALSLAVALTASTATAYADTWDKKTRVSFSHAVEVPGAVLQPGTYVMKLADSSSQRHVVQFMNERENHVYAAAMAIPTYRNRVTDSTVIAFYEAPAGQPEAMKNWYYPGDNYGQEFLYPKGRGGSRLAAYPSAPANDTALNTRNDANFASTTATAAEQPMTQSMSQPTTKPAPTETEAIAAPAPAAEPVQIAQVVAPNQESDEPVIVAQNQPATPPVAGDTALPQTATHLPEIAGLGLLSLVGAVIARRFRAPVS